MNLATYIKTFDPQQSEALLRSILENPLDRVGYGVYADWLMENDEDDKAKGYMDAYNRFDNVIKAARIRAREARNVHNDFGYIQGKVWRYLGSAFYAIDNTIIVSLSNKLSWEALGYDEVPKINTDI